WGDEWVALAQGREGEGFGWPLLIGGAPTSRANTAVKIAPHYRASTVHVLDASRAVGVVNSLLNEELKPEFDKKTRADYERLRQEHSAKTQGRKLLPLKEARANRTPIDWSSYVPPKPEFLGLRAYTSSPGSTHIPQIISLRTLAEYVDWSPFFHAWELRGRYPAIFEDSKMGKQARELFDDAQELLERIIAKDLLIARGVHAFWRANSVGDDVNLYADDDRKKEFTTFYFLRQQMNKPASQGNHCLADYIAPASNSQSAIRNPQLADYLGGFAVSIHG